jgi:hypothetical protein
MSAMGKMVMDAQEDIIDMLNEGIAVEDIDKAIVKKYGLMFQGMVNDVLEQGY